jgi:hypothetical protein
MLKNRYQEILVGTGLFSLVRGIISLSRNRSTLLIDDKRFSVDSYPGHFLSELEILALLRLGRKYEIPELVNLRQFLLPANFKFVTTEKRLELGSSPLANIKEILRKYPELLPEEDLDQVYAEDEEVFNKQFLDELGRFEKEAHEGSLRPKGFYFELKGSRWLVNFYKRFGELFNRDYFRSKSLKYSALLHFLSLSSEEKLKTQLGPEEIPFYFFRAFSPLYRLQDFFLTTQLKRRLTLLGGDFKESTVQFWQLHQGKFENLLLASFEGVISGERVLFFSHLPVEVPFQVQSPFKFFRKSQVVPVKRVTAPFPPTSLTFFTEKDILGSERPYRVFAGGEAFSFYHWPYPELPGSKPDFYRRDLLSAFQKDSENLPAKNGAVEPSLTGSVSLDLRSFRREEKAPAPVLKELPLSIETSEGSIQGFEYWGPFRYQGFGALALTYGIESN